MYCNIIHRPEKALDIQSELIFVNGMVHVPPRNETLVHQQLFSSHTTVKPHSDSRKAYVTSHVQYTYVLGIRMRIRCLTRSTRKDRDRSSGGTTPCCPLPICSRVSKRSKSLEWWRASRFLSSLSCRHSSFRWADSRLPYIWTRSVVV